MTQFTKEEIEEIIKEMEKEEIQELNEEFENLNKKEEKWKSSLSLF